MSLKAFKESLQTCSAQRIRTATTPVHAEPEAESSVTRKPPKSSLRDQFAGFEHFLKPPLPSTSSPALAIPLQDVEPDEPAVTRKPPKFSFRDQFAGLDHFLNPKPPLPSTSSPAPATLSSNSAAPAAVWESRTKRSFSQDVQLQRCGSGVSRVAEEDVAKVANEEDAANVQKRRKVESVIVEPVAAEDGTLHDSEAGLFIQSEKEGPYEPLVLDGTSSGDRVVQVPASINSRLLAHQRDGVKFLYNLYRENRGGILGDDM